MLCCGADRGRLPIVLNLVLVLCRVENSSLKKLKAHTGGEEIKPLAPSVSPMAVSNMRHSEILVIDSRYEGLALKEVGET